MRRKLHQPLAHPPMNILDAIIGKPIKTSDERAEQIGIQEGIPIFGLDALSSAAYGPEAALSLLIPLGLLGVQYIIPISAAIITLLVIVYFSYRQTIAAYPTGGGSYTVARYNLGAFAGLLAAAALLTDYVLTAAVGISAGVGALVSAVPSLQPHTVLLCLGILVVVTLLNLRGVRDAGLAFMLPTYLFVATLIITIAGGVIRVYLSGGHPVPVTPLPPPAPVTEAVTYWLLLKVFASGCTALTGVEAVSNGVKAFREPAVKNAQRTLTVIIFLLAILLAGISYLVKVYGIAATPPGQPGYQSILSMLIGAVFGKGVFYYITIDSLRSFSFREPRVRPFSETLPRHRPEQLLATPLRIPWPPARLHVRHHGSRAPHQLLARCIWRSHRQIDPALCGGSFPGLHALAIRNGGALAEKTRPALAKECSGQWPRGIRYRHHRHRGPCREICRTRLDNGDLHPTIDFSLSPGAASLSHDQRRYELHYSRCPRQPRRAANRRRTSRALELHLQASAGICDTHLAGNRRRPRGARRTFRTFADGVGALRGAALSGRRSRAAQAHHSAVSLPLHHRSHRSVHSRALEKEPRSTYCCGDSRACRRSLVRVFPPQPTRPAPRMDPPGPRQPAHFHRQLALLHLGTDPKKKLGICSDRLPNSLCFPPRAPREMQPVLERDFPCDKFSKFSDITSQVARG